MTAWLIRFLPHALVIAAVLGFIAYVDHRGYERAQADNKAAEERIVRKVGEAVDDIDRKTADRLADIRATERVLQPIISKEIASDPRYSDPACALTPGMFDAISRARALSGAPGADGGSVPTPVGPR